MLGRGRFFRIYCAASLVFSVVTQLDNDILLIDEVLAVGDAAFQKKCLDRITQIVTQGRTVLFVSHDMEKVDSLCPCTIYLEKGTQIADGAKQAVISKYLG